MPSIYESFPSKYIRAADLQGRSVKVTIDRVDFESLGQGAQAQTKPVLYFTGKEKGFVLNKTNAEIIASNYGHETDNWAGAEIELYSMMTEYAGKPVEAIRVKMPMRVPARPPARPLATAGHTEANPPPHDDSPPF